MTIRTAGRTALVAAILAVAGCSGDETAKQLAAMNTSNIQRLSNMYAGFQNMKGGSGPKDEAAFKEFIKAWAPDKLKAMSIDTNDLDKVFTSERDGKPFKVRYGVGGGRGSVDAVVFETDGKEGKKQVGYTGGKVEEVDAATANDLFAGKKPAGGTPAAGANQGGRPSGMPQGAPTGPPK